MQYAMDFTCQDLSIQSRKHVLKYKPQVGKLPGVPISVHYIVRDCRVKSTEKHGLEMESPAHMGKSIHGSRCLRQTR